MKDVYVTITGFRHYYGLKPFKIGSLVRCKKEPGNPHDAEAIRAGLPMVGTVGYLANSPDTAARGTSSAGRIYDCVPGTFYVRVLFTTYTKVICRVEPEDSDICEAELSDWAELYDEWIDEYELRGEDMEVEAEEAVVRF